MPLETTKETKGKQQSVFIRKVDGSVFIGDKPRVFSAQDGKHNDPNAHENSNQDIEEVYVRNNHRPVVGCPEYDYPYNKEVWNPAPGSGILTVVRRDPQIVAEVGRFFEDVDAFLTKFSKPTGKKRKSYEQFISNEILPLLEDSGMKNNKFDVMEACMILAKLSCSRNSPSLTEHIQHQLMSLICKTGTNAHIKTVESILREPLIKVDSVFNDDGPVEKELRLGVYSRVIAVMVASIARGDLPLINISEKDVRELKQVLEMVKRLSKDVTVRKRDKLRYSVELLREGISRIRTGKKCTDSSLTAYLNECNSAICMNNVKDIDFLNTISHGKMHWFDLHLVLYYIHSMTTKHTRSAMELIHQVMNKYIWGERYEIKKEVREDWKFFLLLSTILTDIAMTSETEVIRVDAGSCMITLLGIQELKKSSPSRTILEQKATRLVFGPDAGTRKAAVTNLYPEDDSFRFNIFQKSLCGLYKGCFSEFGAELRLDSDSHIISSATYQEREAVVKILNTSASEIREDHAHKPITKHHQNIITEAYTLHRLNRIQHPNIVRLLAYNTLSLPYHIVTSLEHKGNLLTVLREERNDNPTSLPLLQMCINITDALIYLAEDHMVHRTVMARNVLVGKDNNCKLSGLDYARHLEIPKNFTLDRSPNLLSEDHVYCSINVLPEFVSQENEDFPVRWAAPECLPPQRQFTTASDVWALAVTMYEIFTLGCEPYARLCHDQQVIDYIEMERRLPKEACFEDSIYKLMESCWSRDIYRRPKLSTINSQLKEMVEQKIKCPGAKARRRSLRHSTDLKGLLTRKHAANKENTKRFKREENSSPLTILVSHAKQLAQQLLVPRGKYGDVMPYSGRSHGLVSSTWKGRAVEVETVQDDGDNKHLKVIRALRHSHLTEVLNVIEEAPNILVISEAPTLGSLKDYVRGNRFTQTDLIRYFSQVASAMEYLHRSNIVHGDLRAENIAVTSHMEVKVSRLGRSYLLRSSKGEVNSIYCTASGKLYPDAIPWSAPEVIVDQHFTHASDVWAFGVLAWETFTAASYAGSQESDTTILPYSELLHKDDPPAKQSPVILAFLSDGSRLSKPENCPDWFYCVMHQCWPYSRLQRPPFVAITDCLTSRQPMSSWMMRVWLNHHEESSLSLDTAVRQPEGASHVLPDELHPMEDNISIMCSREFLENHYYIYVNQASCLSYVPEERIYDIIPDTTATDVYNTKL